MRILLSLLCFASSLFAVGSVSQSCSRLGSTDTWVVIFEWVGDASSGTVPSTAARLACGPGSPDFQGYVLIGAEFSPGSPSPTASYDVTITNGVGVDLLGGGGADLSATVPSASTAGSSALPLNGTFSLGVSGNSVASARGRVFVYVQKPGSGSAGLNNGLIQLARLSPAGAEAGDTIIFQASGRWSVGPGGGSGSPGGSSGQMQYNNTGGFAGGPYWNNANGQICVGCSSWSSVFEKLRAVGSTNAVMVLKAGSGNFYADMVLDSGGGAGSGDHAELEFQQAGTPRWALAGVWNGSANLQLVDSDDSYTTRWEVNSTTGETTFSTALGFGGGKGSVRTSSNDTRGMIQFLDNAGALKAQFAEDPAYGWRLSSQESAALNFGVNGTTYGGFASDGVFDVGRASSNPISERGSFYVRGAGNTKLGFGYDSNDGYSWSQSVLTGTNYTPYHINPQGGNVLVGGCAGVADCTNRDSGFRLDVFSSGLTGTARFWDQTATTGITVVSVKAGAGQSTNNLMLFQDFTGVYQGGIDASGAFWTGTVPKRKAAIYSGGAVFSSDVAVTFRNADSLDTGSVDTGFYRNAAGIIEINNGTPGTYRDITMRDIYNRNQVKLTNAAIITGYNSADFSGAIDIGLSRNAAGVWGVNSGTPAAYRDLKLRSILFTDNTEATCDSSTRGTIVMDQGGAGVSDTFRICSKDSADAYDWRPLL